MQGCAAGEGSSWLALDIIRECCAKCHIQSMGKGQRFGQVFVEMWSQAPSEKAHLPPKMHSRESGFNVFRPPFNNLPTLNIIVTYLC